jgi:hypothetical protein
MFGTYFLGFFSTQFLVPLLTIDPQMVSFYTNLFSILLAIGAAITAPILYFCRLANWLN